MPLPEDSLERVAQSVFQLLEQRHRNSVEPCILSQDCIKPSVRQAFKFALSDAYERFYKEHERYLQLFNISFWEHTGAGFLARLFLVDDKPDPSDLAFDITLSLNGRQPGSHIHYVRDLEQTSVDLLASLLQAFESYADLRALNKSKTMQYLAPQINEIRYKLQHNLATPGTCWDYLHWLKEQTLYLEYHRGIIKAKPLRVKPELDKIYISLQAKYEPRVQEGEEKASENGPTTSGDEESMPENGSINQKTRIYPEILSLSETIDQFDQLVILGEPGSGKSTWLSYLAFQHASALLQRKGEVGVTSAGIDLGPARFPILISIASYAEYMRKHSDASLAEFLNDFYQGIGRPSRGLIDLLMNEPVEKNRLILLDGLDLVADPTERRKIIYQIEEFASRYKGYSNKFVITSREADYFSAPLDKSFAHYHICKMDEKRIREFLEKWYQHTKYDESGDQVRQEIDRIMHAVRTNRGVRRLARTPLLLLILAFVSQDERQLPQRRIELYNRAAETLVHTWRPLHRCPLPKSEFINMLLGTLAYWLHFNKPTTGTASREEIHQVMCEELRQITNLIWNEKNSDIEKSVNDFLQAACYSMGILVECTPGQYGFLHQTFEEYYAARHLVRRGIKRAELVKAHLHDIHWDEPILLALGYIAVGLDSPDDASDLLEEAILKQEIDKTQMEQVFVWDYFFALRCLAEQIPVNKLLVKKLMRQVADDLLYQTGIARFRPYQEGLQRLLIQLRESRAALVLSLYLVDALNGNDERVRRRAARNLGLLGEATHRVITALSEALYRGPDDVRQECAYGLAQLSQYSKDAEQALLEALCRDSDLQIRLAVVNGLGHLPNPSSEIIDELLSILRTGDDQICSSAIKSLGRLKRASEPVVKALLDALHDPRNLIRQQAATSLGLIGNILNQEVSERVIEELFSTLKDDDSWVRNASAESLKHFNMSSDKCVNLLIDSLHDDNKEFLTPLSVIEALGVACRSSKKACEELLVILLEVGKDFRERRAAARALKQAVNLSSLSIQAIFYIACMDEDHRVVETVEEVLKELALSSESISGEVVSVLRNALSDPESNLNYALVGARILVRSSIGGDEKEVLDVLVRALRRKDHTRMRYKAAESLGRMQSLEHRHTEEAEQIAAEVLETLFEALKDQNARMRARAARLLGKIGLVERQTVVILHRQLLEDSNADVIITCGGALAELGRRARGTELESEIVGKLTQSIAEDYAPAAQSARNSQIHSSAFDGLWQLHMKGVRLPGKS